MYLVYAYVLTSSVAADVTASLQTKPSWASRFWEHICPKAWSELILFITDKRILSKLKNATKRWNRVDKNSCDKPTGCGSVCEGEKKFVFHRFSTMFLQYMNISCAVFRDSVDTVVLAAQLQMCEDQNSIPIITLPIYYLFYKLWGINNETCTLYISQSSRSLFNLGRTAHIISHMMVQESKAKSNHWIQNTDKLNQAETIT